MSCDPTVSSHFTHSVLASGPVRKTHGPSVGSQNIELMKQSRHHNLHQNSLHTSSSFLRTNTGADIWMWLRRNSLSSQGRPSTHSATPAHHLVCIHSAEWLPAFCILDRAGLPLRPWPRSWQTSLSNRGFLRLRSASVLAFRGMSCWKRKLFANKDMLILHWHILCCCDLPGCWPLWGGGEISMKNGARCRREILRIRKLMKLWIFDIETNRNQWQIYSDPANIYLCPKTSKSIYPK